MLDGIADTTLTAMVGLFGGILLGLAARLGRFCTLGAIEDLLYQNSTIRVRMWALAIGVAIIGTFSLIGLDALEASETVYLSFQWNPLASILGGLTFGYGMALTGTCGFGCLARLGGGDLRSFVIVLVMGISAYMALSGPLAHLRVGLFPMQEVTGPTPPGIAHWMAEKTGLSPVTMGVLIGLGILGLALTSRQFLKNPMALFWGMAVGVAVVTGWAGSAWVARNGFAAVPVESHTFSAPLGDTILYAMTSSGNTLNFGVGSVSGVLIGALAATLIKGQFRWEACEDNRELRRQILGASLMGVGAVVAFGCTIGQGVSAFSVLFYGAPVTLISIFLGAALGLHQLISGFSRID